MKNKAAFALAIACAVSIVAAGCARTGPIQNVNDAAVTTPSAKALTASQVRSAVITAGTSLGWRMVDAGPGKLEGTLNLRTHTAVVDIPYSAKTYSIVYKSSENLYEANGQIHTNYNGWVQNLDRAIRTELSRN